VSEAVNTNENVINAENTAQTITENTENTAELLPEGAVRIKFEKRGSLKFISHLDIQRTVKTALRRAKIPVWYSQGFNPHPKMTFALPLSIGTESLCEYIDIRLTRPMERETLIRSLDGALSPEMNVLDAYIPQSKLSEIAWAEYELSSPQLLDAEVAKLSAESIPILKNTKNGEKEVDIAPMIREYKANGDTIRVTLSADSAHYLNPEYVASVLRLTDWTTTRTAVFFADGSEFR